MKQCNLNDIRIKLETFSSSSNLNESQKTELRILLEQAAKLKTGALLIEEKSFRCYLVDLLAYKFLFKKTKNNESEIEVKFFILDFFKLLFPSVSLDNIDIDVEISIEGKLNIIEKTELTKTLFDTIINTNIR